MNERIRELAVAAGAGEWGDSVIPAMMDIEKFAELIVQECTDVSKNYAGGSMPLSISLAIKEHFGVK